MPTRRFICWPLHQNLPLTYITNLALDPCFCRHTIPPSAAKGKVDNEFAERIRYSGVGGKDELGMSISNVGKYLPEPLRSRRAEESQVCEAGL
ncbi:hypothetical protein LY78DRAFT_656559 [Colletotrichum sublineola]|nr:hypothetical protein LY78DRAFT_656559 [Colletotrichum sublineola]